MKKLTLLLGALVIAGATFACDGKGKGDKACCKKGEKKECCKKGENKSCDKHETAKKDEKASTDKKS
ncbi:MAG: hypothetical protein ACK4EY_02065 [Flavipsychrobacter sp.]|jgi:hypothetical protein|nr:hypothetical protein [Chitinophagales bacterium]